MQLNPTTKTADNAALSVAGTGEAMIVWRQCSPCRVWSSYFNGDAWQHNLTVSGETNSEKITDVAVSVRNGGEALCVWAADQAAIESIFASEYEPGTGWSKGHLIEDDNHNRHGTILDVEFSSANVGLATWVREVDVSTGDFRRKIFGALYR